MPPLVAYGSSDEEDDDNVPQENVRPEYLPNEKIKVTTNYQVLTTDWKCSSTIHRQFEQYGTNTMQDSCS